MVGALGDREFLGGQGMGMFSIREIGLGKTPPIRSQWRSQSTAVLVSQGENNTDNYYRIRFQLIVNIFSSNESSSQALSE